MEERKYPQSEALFARAIERIPGGVNSPVRSFGAVGGRPLFIHRAKGAYLYDEDQNSYIDYINAWGPMLLGHAPDCVLEAAEKKLRDSLCFGAPTRVEVELAERVHSCVPSMEMLRMVNSGTEATFSAIRAARGFTQRDKIIKFEGCYHGHSDAFLVAAGSGGATFRVPNSLGVPSLAVKDTLIAFYNDLSSVELLLDTYPKQVAAIIVEPVAGNMGCVPPERGFLEGLRKLCDQSGVLLIFDEVMTGFRLSLGGAQQLYDLQADLTTLGKILGGGMPVAAYGGRREIMELISPLGPIYQAGTLSGHPLGMACGIAMLDYLIEHPNIYDQLEELGKSLSEGIKAQATAMAIPHLIQRVGSMMTFFFTDKKKLSNFSEVQTVDQKKYARFFHALLKRGVYFPPSQFEAAFLSTSIDESCLQHTLRATEEALSEIASE